MKAYPGMVVAVRAWFYGAAIWHVGIVDRNGQVVSNKRAHGGVMKESLASFVGNEKWEIVGYCHVGDYYELLDRLDAPPGRFDYHDTLHNCEHWAFRILNREEQSPQLARANSNGFGGVVAGGAVAALAGFGPLGWAAALLFGGAAPQWIADVPSIAAYYQRMGLVRPIEVTQDIFGNERVTIHEYV